MKHPILLATALVAATTLTAACHTPEAEGAAPPPRNGTEHTVAARDTAIDDVIEAAGTAEPMRQATLSTKLMGSVQAVLVHEGDVVAEGAPLARVDTRDLDARRAQVAAQAAEAEAVRRDAQTNAERFRRLYAESVATRAQLDAVETGLARADAAVRLAQAAAAEVEATAGYGDIRSPFAGTVTQRMVDPGAFAAPGTPLVTVEDAGRLRIAANAAPDAVRGLHRGQRLEARIEGVSAEAVVEGVVPAPGGNTYIVNAVVDNGARRFLSHSAAVLLLPQASRSVLVIPAAAVSRDGDLTGVRLVQGERAERRWVRVGRQVGADVEVLSGLTAGDHVAVPSAGGTR